MNSSTIAGFINGTTRNTLAPLVLAGTAEVALNAVTDTGTAIAVLAVPSATAVVGSNNPLGPNANPALLAGNLGADHAAVGTNRPYFNSTSFDGRAFKVRVAGNYTAVATASQTLILRLRLGTTLSGTVVLTPATITTSVVAGGTFNFVLESTFIWDSTSQLLDGVYQGTVANIVATPLTTTQATAVAAQSALSFVLSAQQSVASAMTINVRDFSLDLV